jgi:3-hydroxyacyl-[acyl-carrier-protein] dehydratase
MKFQESGMLVDFTLAEQAPCVQGHFPDAPVVPGAWLLAKIDLCLRAHLPTRRLAGFTKVKFVAPLLPDMAAQLDIDIAQAELAPASEPVLVKVLIRSGDQLIVEARARLL